MFRSILTYTGTAVLAATTLAVPAAAQEDPNLTGVLPARQEPAGEEGFGAYGSGSQDTWIAATQFTGKFMPTNPDLTYGPHHYYTAPGVANQRYFAQIPLPSGAQIQVIQCFVNDASAANNVGLGFQVYEHDMASNTPAFGFILSWGSTGSSGFQQPSLNVPAVNGAVRYNVGTRRLLYYLAADISSDTSLRGCRIQWVRTVSPSPAVASFPNDVPTSSPVFRFVEAMAASGLTGGCGPGAFCPDTAVTRGQLAVFLSVALGLHFPN
jgi:hypothetical protein